MVDNHPMCSMVVGAQTGAQWMPAQMMGASPMLARPTQGHLTLALSTQVPGASIRTLIPLEMAAPTGRIIAPTCPTPISTMKTVTATDMESPISTELSVDGRLAWGTLTDVEAGDHRTVVISYRDEAGRLCSGAADVFVRSGHRTEIEPPSIQCGGHEQRASRDALRASSSSTL